MRCIILGLECLECADKKSVSGLVELVRTIRL